MRSKGDDGVLLVLLGALTKQMAPYLPTPKAGEKGVRCEMNSTTAYF